MRLITLSYLVLVVICLVFPPSDCKRGGGTKVSSGKNRCKKFNLENGKVKVKSRGRLAKLTCKKKYTMIEGDRFLSCVRKQWTGSVPKCIKRGCEEIHEIAHGKASALFQGALIQFKCNPGYVLNGSPSLACDGNTWNSSVPYCGHRVPQEEVELTCNFEDSGICSWEVVNTPADKGGWKRGQGGPTMPGSSAPSTDHSTSTQMGHFMLVDAAAMGTTAQLFSPVFSPPTEAPTCFVFYYYIQKHAENSISISFKPDNISTGLLSVVLRVDSGRPREDGWTMYYFDLNPYIVLEQHFQIILESLPGQGYKSDVAIDDVALAAGSQCIEYELEYEEQQNPPNTTIMSTTTMSTTTKSLINTEDTSYSENTTSTNQDEETVTYETQSNEETVTYQIQHDDLMNITSIITTNDLQKEDLTSLPTTEITHTPNTSIIITENNRITDIQVNQTATYPNTQTPASNITFQTTTNNPTTMYQSDILTLGPKITLLPITSPPVITILPPTASTPLKQRTPEATIQIGTNITLNTTTPLVQQNNTDLPTKMPYLSTKSPFSTDFSSLKFSTKIVTSVQNNVTSQPPSTSAFTPPPPPTLPPHPFSEISTSPAISTQELIPEIRTDSTTFYFQTNSTEQSSHTQTLTTQAPPFIPSSTTLPTTFISSRTFHTTPQKFTPPPPPPLPPHPFSEMTTAIMLTTNMSDITLNPITSTKNNTSYSYASTISSSTVKTSSASIKTETNISIPMTTALFSQSTFFTDTTKHATSTLSTNEINFHPTTVNEVTSTTKPSTTKRSTTSTSMDILTTPKPSTTKNSTTSTAMDILTTPKPSTTKKSTTSTAIDILTTPKPSTTKKSTTSTTMDILTTPKPSTTKKSTTSTAIHILTTPKPSTTKKSTTSTAMDILTTPKPSTTKKSTTSTAMDILTTTEIVTTSNPEFSSTPIIDKTKSTDIKNKTSKYSKGAIAAIAVLITVLCVLGIYSISVVVQKYRDYAKQDKLLEDLEGSNSSIQFSYRREVGVSGGGGERQGEVGLPAFNFYGYENPGTPV